MADNIVPQGGEAGGMTTEELEAAAEASDPFIEDVDDDDPIADPAPVEPAKPAEPAEPAEPAAAAAEPDDDGQEEPGEPAEERTIEERTQALRDQFKDDPVQLAQSLAYLRQMQTSQGLELGESRKENTEFASLIEQQNKLIEALKQGKSVEPEVDDGGIEKDDPVASADDIQQLLLDGDVEKATQKLTERVESKVIKTLEKRDSAQALESAQSFNNDLADTRARELLLKLATDAEDKQAIIRFSETGYKPTTEEQAIILPSLNKEIAWIQENLLPNTKTMKYSGKAFTLAQQDLYGNVMLQAAKKNGAQGVIDQLSKPEATAVTLTPKGGSLSESTIDLSKVKTAGQVRKVAPKMTTEELKAAVDASEPKY